MQQENSHNLIEWKEIYNIIPINQNLGITIFLNHFR